MFKRSFSLIYFSLLMSLSLLVSCRNSGTSKPEITVFCCAGLTEVITAMSDSFMQQNKVDIHLNFASSGTLARQLKNGAPADIFLSASNEWMTYCIEKNLVDSNNVATFLTNRLVWISSEMRDSTNRFRIEKIDSTYKIAIGDPSHVPAGAYAHDYLQRIDKWEILESQIIPCRDVKNTLFMVEQGEVELGIVYYSDAKRSKKVQLLEIIPDSLQTPINLSMALVKNNVKAADFFAFLKNDSNKVLYKKYGFNPLNE